MKINRITYSIDKKDLSENLLKDFNKMTSYYEELLFNFLPKKAEIGGYGFLNIKFDLQDSKPNFKAYGQIIETLRPISEDEFRSFFNGSIEKQVEFLGQQLSFVLIDAENQMPVDSVNFNKAISNANANHAGFEQELKVSRNHKSRKLKVEICRVVKPGNEFISCRIKNKAGEILDDFNLLKNSSVYDASYEFSKSKWNYDTLAIYDRFDEEKYSIDVTKHLK